MDSRLLATIIIFPIWLTLVLVFRKQRQWLLYYMFAAFGFTIQLVFLAEHFGLDQIMVNIASFHSSLLAKALGIPNEILSQGRIMLTSKAGENIILKIGIECSAILEATVLVSLVVFYPAFRRRQKLLKIIFGLSLTYVINILRMFIIVFITFTYGTGAIYIAHALIGRFFFFIAAIILYWYIITKPSIRGVGLALRDSVQLDELTKQGKETNLKHSIAQAVAAMLIIGVALGSFKWSNDWQKSFGFISPKKERPIIYPEETEVETFQGVSGEESEVILRPLNFNKIDNRFEFKNSKPAELLGLTADGSGTFKFILQINGQAVKEDWLEKDNRELTWSAIQLETGDTIIVKIVALQNPEEFKLSLKMRNQNE